MPSIGPGSWPWSFNACCTCFTSSLPVARLEREVDISEDDVSEEEDMPEELPEDMPEPLRLLLVP